MSRAWRYNSYLREVPIDVAAFDAEVDRLLEDIATARSQPARLLAMLGEAAPLLRIAGRFEESRKTAAAAIALAELIGDADAVFMNKLSLAQAMQREGRFDLSTALFDQLLLHARSSPELGALLHDVLFAAGVNLLDQRRPAEAARCFRESQVLRREAGLDGLLEISAEALRLAKAPAQVP